MAVNPKAEIEAALKQALEKIAPEHVAEKVYTLERPRQAGHGDYSSTAALQLAKPLKKSPREIAESLSKSMHVFLSPGIASMSIEGPGFLNFRIESGTKTDVIRQVLEAGAAWGRKKKDKPQAIQVEFVSANPTGPLHVGHGRQAAIGDALASVLEAQGDK